MISRATYSPIPLLLATVLFACSAPPPDAPSDSSPGPSANDDANNRPTTQKASAPTVPFQPSNVGLSGLELSDLQDVVVHGEFCDIQSSFSSWPCASDAGFAAPALHFKVITQPDGSSVGVYVVHSLRITPGAKLTVQGPLPLVIIAITDITVAGTVDLSGAAELGGWRPGPGNGVSGTTKVAGGGGSFCGIGGSGATILGSALGASGGAPYGNAELSPLVVGSAGGTSGRDANASAIEGGGALQLVAGQSIVIESTGGILAGGAGGEYGANTDEQPSGGGSGGAILLEAPAVTVAGYLTANGGGGGANDYGRAGIGTPGSADEKPASGGHDGSYATGGFGSAGATTAGGNGTSQTGAAAGGGGGAGRIRINTKGGAASITGIVSPALSTSCATQGSLK